ncbi:MAG: helix-turn-helix domain-containing protein [Candidatus Kerfeldbacteria bacterium]|nr:helix-turn-helix domain-containing protein [Candidatus Kerfeldbacteria bacterium]
MKNSVFNNYNPIQVLSNALAPNVVYHKYKPAGILSEFVECFWELSVNKKITKSTSLPILPDGCADIVFSLQNERPVTSWISGTMSVVSTVKLTKTSHFFGVRFWPGKLYPLFCTPMKIFAQQDIDVYRIFPEAKTWNQQLAATQSFAQRIQIVEGCLNNFIMFSADSNVQIDSIIEDIISQQGRISVTDFAQKHHVTDRQLRRLFEISIGISPKTFARTIRFQYLLQDVLNTKKGSSIRQALRYGYYDQPHLINDLKVICNKTPQEFADFIGI